MRDKILQAIKIKGPVVPAQLLKETKQNSILIGAQLSELVSEKKLKVTSVKKGGSPFYYLPEQDHMLENLTKYLDAKDQEVISHLKKEQVIEDDKCSPFQKVSLRNTKDYAVPLKVNRTRLFWKYFLLSQEEAIAILKKRLDQEQQLKQKADQPKTKKEETKIKQEIPKQKEKTEKKIVREEPEVQKQKKEIQKEKPLAYFDQKQKKQVEKKEITRTKEKKEAIETKETAAAKESIETKEVIQPTIHEVFFTTIKKFFKSKNIIINNIKVIRKEREYDLEVEVPTAIGNAVYFCKARNKKQCSAGDVSSAYLVAQSKQLPLLFITTGQVAQKAKQMVNNELKQASIHEVNDQTLEH